MTELLHQPPRMAKANGIELCYDIFGADDADPIVLIMGLGAQMIHWDDDFCKDLAGRGFLAGCGRVSNAGPPGTACQPPSAANRAAALLRRLGDALAAA